ncbi:MAG: L,D-transpeptidase family protein [Verrucomicrobiota bacterium]
MKVPRGETLYLDSLNSVFANQEKDKRRRGGLTDTVSYWDGDGVSGSPSIKIRLSEQKAYFYKGGQLVGVSGVSTGREGFETPAGSYRILQKSPNHRSNLYGEIVDQYGNVINDDADVRKDRPPPGGKFVGAPMPYFMRLTNSGVGMHEGYLPGFAASHGCIRMPGNMASTFFQNVSIGTPVTITY